MMRRSLKDVIVEPQRASLIPHFYDMKVLAYDLGCIGFSISGAGPSMFALCDNSLIAEKIGEAAINLYTKHKIEVDYYLSKINLEGAYKY